MASLDYWQKERTALFEGEIAPLNRLPMSTAARRANGPMFANIDALRTIVLGCPAATANLLDYLPDLLDDLTCTDWAATLPEYDRAGRLASLPEHAAVGTWLRTGSTDASLSQAAFEALLNHQERYGGRISGPTLLHLMLLSIEASSIPQAACLYEQWEKRPISMPPESRRFAKNPRALLYAHLRLSPLSDHSGFLFDCLHLFLAQATRWDKDVQPVPYVGLVEAARITRTCLQLTGRPSDLEAVVALIR